MILEDLAFLSFNSQLGGNYLLLRCLSIITASVQVAERRAFEKMMLLKVGVQRTQIPGYGHICEMIIRMYPADLQVQ